MSAHMDTLLADTRAMERRKAPPPKPEHATRADRIIAEGDAKRLAYRRDNPTADTAMVYGAQIGHLHAEVRRLDAELAAFVPVYRRDQYIYTDLYVPELGGMAICGWCPNDDEDTSEPPICLHELWVNGRDICMGVSEELAQELIDRITALQREGIA